MLSNKEDSGKMAKRQSGLLNFFKPASQLDPKKAKVMRDQTCKTAMEAAVQFAARLLVRVMRWVMLAQLHLLPAGKASRGIRKVKIRRRTLNWGRENENEVHEVQLSGETSTGEIWRGTSGQK